MGSLLLSHFDALVTLVRHRNTQLQETRLITLPFQWKSLNVGISTSNLVPSFLVPQMVGLTSVIDIRR